ncbi:hypothetical protein [Methylotenera sp.]|uniref:hypothetical protein n=1 Tax=Methylotenera sp. TaxID=2051956 RepID=UPI00248985E7|nr:hypothetical protein [Methylotenera sp.]MDI1299549.1 hypothetical protein [Methylotenera sp.]
MENFTWQHKKIEFSKQTGEVFSNHKFSETHVSSSGGGGYVDAQYGGNVAAASVHSTVTTVHEFWIKDEAGKQHAINLRGKDIPLAVGQKVTLVLAGFVGKDRYYASLFNHDAERHWQILGGAELINLLFFPEQSVMKFLIKACIAIAIYILMLNFTSGYVTVAIHIGLICYCVNWYRNKSKKAKELDAHLEKIAKEIAQVNHA